MTTFSVTEREHFKRCRRMWDYSSTNRQSLQPLFQGLAFSLGTLVHQALDEWTKQCYGPDYYRKPIEPPNLKDIFLTLAVNSLDKAQSVYSENVGVKPSDSELDPLLSAIDLGKDMMENYQSVYKWPYKPHWRVVATEQSYSAIVPGTGHTLKGRLDAIILDPNGDAWIVEHKTYSIRPNIAVLDSNNQFLAYIWLVREQNLLYQVRGIAYDGLWKKQSPSKKEPIDSLFFRTLLERPQYEVDEFADMLRMEVSDMANSPSIYTNRRWEGCRDCAYERLCTAQSKGDDTEFILSQNFIKGEQTTDEAG